VEQVIRIQATRDPAVVRPNNPVITWVSWQKAAKAMRDANPAMDEDRPGAAADTLHDCVQRLRSYSPAVAVAIRSLYDVERNIHDG